MQEVSHPLTRPLLRPSGSSVSCCPVVLMSKFVSLFCFTPPPPQIGRSSPGAAKAKETNRKENPQNQNIPSTQVTFSWVKQSADNGGREGNHCWLKVRQVVVSEARRTNLILSARGFTIPQNWIPLLCCSLQLSTIQNPFLFDS